MANTAPKFPYPKAPIRESVIHLAVNDVTPNDELQKLVKRFEANYPHQEPLSTISVGVDNTGGSVSVDQRFDGYRITSADQADIMLVSSNGLAIARLAPYPGWEHLRARANAAWADWRSHLSARTLGRVGIRYINRIDIPISAAEPVDIDSYIGFTPRVPKFSDHQIEGYFVQVTNPTNLDYWSATITSYIESPAPLIDHASIVLDIDIFRTKEIPGREEELWNMIDSVRPVKNVIFEACITDKARKLFT